MQNKPKSFWAALVSIILLVIIIIVVGTYFLQPKAVSMKTFVEGNGLYSFQFPADATVIPLGSSGSLFGPTIKSADGSFQITIMPDTNDRALKALTSMNTVKYEKTSLGKISGYDAEQYNTHGKVSEGEYGYVSLQVVHVPVPDLGSLGIVFITQSKDGKSGNDLIKSLKIDTTKIDPVVQAVKKSEETARQKGNDALIKAKLSQIRVNAELYYDKASSYAGLCAKDAATKSALASTTPAATSCKDASKSYAVSVALSTGDFYCVDSTGLAKNVATLNTGTACAK